MKTNLIENNINKMKSLIDYNIGETISEQNEKYGNCKGTNTVPDPILHFAGFSKDKAGKPKRGKIRFTAYFGATISSEKVYQKALLMAKQALIKKLSEENKNFLDTHSIDVLNVEQVMGSASNYNTYALQPTYNNKGKEYTDAELSQPPFDTLPKVGDTRWDQNLGYAENRWKKLISIIKNKGKNIGFAIKNEITPQNITAKITDTGGCIDEKRDISKYPNPGQYVDITFYVGFSLIPLGDEEKRKVFNCAQGLRIIVGYFKKGGGATTIDGIPIPANSGEHGCDFATFDIKCNGVEVGIANMNNGQNYFKKKSGTRLGISQSDNPNLIKRISPSKPPPTERGKGGQGESAVNVFAVNDELLKQMINKSPQGLLQLTIEGKQGSLTRSTEKQAKGYHGDAPMICAYTVDRNEKLEKIIYGPKEPYGKISGDVSGNERNLGKAFNPCDSKQKNVA